jgi:hypothetical protein
MRLLLLLIIFFQSPLADAQGLFGNNKKDDSFAIRSIEDGKAKLQGIPKDLKAGDMLYYNRSPFQFKVLEVSGTEVVIALPARHELRVGTALLRNATDPIKKSIQTESRLRQALED